MEILQTIVALIWSWIFVAYLVGGLALWWVLTIGIARLIYSNDGERAANMAAWIALFLTLLVAGLGSYLWLGEQWLQVGILTLTAAILPLVAALWVTLSE